MFSFVYSRGAKAGERRSAKLLTCEPRDTSILFVCEEIDRLGRPYLRKYWPSCTSGARYSLRTVGPVVWEELDESGVGVSEFAQDGVPLPLEDRRRPNGPVEF